MMARRDPEGTRALLLEAAFIELHEHGLKGASLDRILTRTELTKGALYHHFPNKEELVLAVAGEVIGDYLNEMWIRPVSEAEDPALALIESVNTFFEETPEEMAALGCPLGRLAHEAPTDTRIHERVSELYDKWRTALREAFQRGKESGHIRDDVDPDGIATFVIVCNQGFSNWLRCGGKSDAENSAVPVFITFLESLRKQP